MVSTGAYLYNFENHEIFVNDISKNSNSVPFAYELLHIDLKLILRTCKYQHGTSPFSFRHRTSTHSFIFTSPSWSSRLVIRST